MNIAQKLTIQLIRYEIADISVDKELLEAVTDDVLKSVYTFSVEQDVAYIVGSALSKLGFLDGDIKAAFFNEQLSSVYRSEQFKHELNNIFDILSNNNITYIPLKGAVIKKYYSKPEMRTSCDVDILIHNEDLEKSLELLYANGFKYVSKCQHDVMLSSPANVYIELHYTLNEYEFAADEILKNAWDYAKPINGLEYEFDTYFFVFYHLAHIARHMYTGGCGIRPFADLCIILRRMDFAFDKLNELLRQSGLERFAESAFNLTNYWFGDNQDISQVETELQNYILKSGIYGNLKNKITVINEKNGNKSTYIRKIIFPPMEIMKKKYHILNTTPYLLPAMYVYRWIESLFKGSYRMSFKYLAVSKSITAEKQNEVAKLMKNLDLM